MKVVVVGSLNCDLVTRVPRLPRPGETTLASRFDTFVGGKGANQAIAAARAARRGVAVAMVGRIGRDSHGDALLLKLDEARVDRSRVAVDPDAATGVALVTVDDAGENSIVVAPNANARLAPDTLGDDVFAEATVLLLQLEVPIETVARAAALASRAGAHVILVPAPAPPGGLPDELLRLVDTLVPNETEARALAGLPDATPEACAARLLDRGVGRVVVTLGAEGALLVERTSRVPFPALPVAVVDTTAAGDAFAGALGASIAAGASIHDAVRCAIAAGSLACTRMGAEPSLPRAAEIDAALARA